MLDPSQYPSRAAFVSGGAMPQTPQMSPLHQAAASQANAMLQNGASMAPTGAWTEGMSRVANALMGGYQKSQLANQTPQAPPQSVPVASPIQPGGYGPQMGGVLGTGSLY